MSRASHFWVIDTPEISSSLVMSRGRGDADASAGGVTLFVRDASGFPCNELRVGLEPGRSSVLEMRELLLGCKVQYGLRHARLTVTHHSDTVVRMRYHNADTAPCVMPAFTLDDAGSTFYPITLGSEVDSYLGVVNPSSERVLVTVRLISGKRTPETVMEIPSEGAQVLSVRAEFEDYVETVKNEDVQGYLRIRTRSVEGVGTTLLSRLSLASSGGEVGRAISRGDIGGVS